MPRPRLTVGTGSRVDDLAAALNEMQRIAVQGWSIGEPVRDNSIAFLRGEFGVVRRPPQTMTPGDNMQGNWNTLTLDTTADIGYSQNIRVYHGLGLPKPTARPGRNQVLNVRWTVMGIRYNTDAAAPAACGPPDSRVTLGYVDGAVDRNWIELRAWSNFVLEGANNGAAVVTSFFWPVSQ